MNIDRQPETQPSPKRRVVLYHDHCIDGFTAAWAAWRIYYDSAEYIPVRHGQEPPVVAGADVLIVDFSYPRPVLEAMAAEARSMRVLDHHKTAQDELAGLPYVTFDLERSGAGLTWDVLHEGVLRPWLIDYVEDRDLWRFRLPFSREVNAYVGAQPRLALQRWEGLSRTPVDHAVQSGSAIRTSIERYVEQVAAQAVVHEVEGVRVPIVNAPFINISELLNSLAQGTPFAVGWSLAADGRFHYSLRSSGEVDVTAIAKRHGGGGHPRAAGFTSKLPPWVLWPPAGGQP